MFDEFDGLKKELVLVSEDYFGEKDTKIYIDRAATGRGDYVIRNYNEIEIEHTRAVNPGKLLEDYMKIKAYRVANSPFFKEQVKEKDDMIVELKRKVDRLEEMLYTTLSTDENKLTEL